MDNWKHHKTKVASYWLVKLDSVKQRKVSDTDFIFSSLSDIDKWLCVYWCLAVAGSDLTLQYWLVSLTYIYV